MNINTVTVDELEKLLGVGPKISEATISFREKNGGFQQKTDIMNVKGIGPEKYDAIDGHICAD